MTETRQFKKYRSWDIEELEEALMNVQFKWLGGQLIITVFSAAQEVWINELWEYLDETE